MGRVYAAIILARQHQHRREIGFVHNMVVGRVAVKRFELIGIFHGAKFRHIESAIGVQLHAQHVVDANMRHDCLHEIGMLSEGCAHEQSAIAAALDYQL